MKVNFEGKKDNLQYYVCPNREEMGKLAADIAVKQVKKVLEDKEEVRIIFASAPSQNEFLRHFTASKEIDWLKVVGFHMDEYIGLPEDSDQWFKKYLEENLVNKVKLKSFHFIDGTKNANEMKRVYSKLLAEKPIDICCLGIGENGHIAFNDPPVADFNDPKMIKEVALDEFSRQQQVNDGCFVKLEDVPTHALSLTIPTLTAATTMICTVPGPTKKDAVKKVLHDDISTECPATILRKHQGAHLILDEEAYGGE